MISTARHREPIADRYEVPTLDATVCIDRRDPLRTRHDEARKAGFEAGYEAGLMLAEAEIAEIVDHHRSARDHFLRAAFALEAGFERLAERDAVALEAIEADVVSLAIELASAIVGRELAVTTEPVRDAIARALRLVPDRGLPKAHVHPDDARAATESLDADPRWRGLVEVVGDVRIEPGGCVMEIGECRIDAQITPALERMRAALAG